MEAIDPEVANGLWFTKGGVGFKVGNEEHAPALYLSRHAKGIIGRYPDVANWVREHPLPSSKPEIVVTWHQLLSEQFAAVGWHILWRGVLFTDSDIAQVKIDFAALPTELKSHLSHWPLDAMIDVHCYRTGEQTDVVSWAALNRQPVPARTLPQPATAPVRGPADGACLAEEAARDATTISPGEKSSRYAIRTYTLFDHEIVTPDGRSIWSERPLTVTAGSQALEPGVSDGKTLIRFKLASSCPGVEGAPRMTVRIGRTPSDSGEKQVPLVLDDACSVELVFDNKTFLSEAKEMPHWLVESLEFVAKKLRDQYALNKGGGLDIEQLS